MTKDTEQTFNMSTNIWFGNSWEAYPGTNIVFKRITVAISLTTCKRETKNEHGLKAYSNYLVEMCKLLGYILAGDAGACHRGAT